MAITGSLPAKANNPAGPITIAEQVESTHAAFEAGASIVQPMSKMTRAIPPPTLTALPV
jgi:hypothetical protein